MLDEQTLQSLAGQLAAALQARDWRLATAESCTGGWVAKICTDLAGSSRWFERGFVTYDNEAKQEMLSVEAAVLAEQGAVSETVVRQMATGALLHSHAQLSLAISGIAGPGGATVLKPVGMVCFAWAVRDAGATSATHYFQGDRDAVRRQAVAVALQGSLDVLR
ncbi:MAG: nicotinamide-nucleotide amidohydrolase family protein [Thiohalomonadaceae bacterium]